MIGTVGKVVWVTGILGVLVSGNFAAERILINSDPMVHPEIDQIEVEAKQLVAALASYQTAKGYYPRSLQDLPQANPAWQKYRYETNDLTAVFAAPECEQRRKDVSGRVFFGDTYKTWQTEFVRQCVRGYSRFVLKSERLRTKWSINNSTVVFAKFMSATGQWDVSWCKPGKRTHLDLDSRDCGGSF
jgi:hypothetical protein